MIRLIEKIDTFTIDKQTVIANLNDALNDFNYGVVVDGQTITDDSEIEAVFRKNLYRTLSCKEFIEYRTGVCWDYTHYEAIYFLRRLGMTLVKDNWLRFDNTFSMYYITRKNSLYS